MATETEEGEENVPFKSVITEAIMSELPAMVTEVLMCSTQKLSQHQVCMSPGHDASRLGVANLQRYHLT